MSSAAEELEIRSREAVPAGPSEETTWRTLEVFCGYRIVLALLVGAAFTLFNFKTMIGIDTPGVIVPTVILYAVAAVVLLAPARLRDPGITLQVMAGVMVDVAAIVMLMYASGGVRSGLGVILLVSLAAAGLITRGRLAFFPAAIASIAVLLDHTFRVLRHDAPPNDFFQAGLISVAFFATAGLASTLARYARSTEQIAEARKVDLANLSQINELVIRDMQDGILVVDSEGRIRQHNPRAMQLLGPLPSVRRPTIQEYAPEIASLLDAWRKGSETTFMQLRGTRVGGELQVHFVPIGSGNPAPTVVFVEDVGRMRQQAQHLKLVALGRLTASIAHEIRNPLSSIGHAADLLAESEDLKESEERLLSIIRGNVFRLDRIVQEVLYLNRRDRAQPEAIEARGYLTNFAHEFCANEKVPDGALAIDVRTSQRLWFDRQHLDQVLWNLVRNAWRHSRKMAGSVQISVSPATVPAALHLDVRDDGMGVSQDAQPHLFEPFFTTDHQGTGLGLYIARELCEGNGARIEWVPGPSGHFRVMLKGA